MNIDIDDMLKTFEIALGICPHEFGLCEEKYYCDQDCLECWYSELKKYSFQEGKEIRIRVEE